jgi:integrase/recombinase XerC
MDGGSHMLSAMIGIFRRRAEWPLQEYRTHLELAVAPTSVATRWYAVRLFAESHPDPWAVRRSDIEAYIAALQGRDGGAAQHSYRRSVLASLRMFYAWAIATGRTRADPTAGIRMGSGRDGRGRTCDEFTYKRAMREAPDEDQRLMVELMGEAALRDCEVAAVRGEDVAPDGRWLSVTGKGSKQRDVPISPRLAAAILSHGPGWRFPGGRGREGGHITPGNVGVKVGRLVRPYSAHALRHRAATAVYRDTHNIVTVQRVLGHDSIATTQVYLGVSDDEVWSSWTGAIDRADQAGGSERRSG